METSFLQVSYLCTTTPGARSERSPRCSAGRGIPRRVAGETFEADPSGCHSWPLGPPPPTGGRYSRSRHLPHSTHLRPSSPPSFPVLELPVIFPWPLAQSLCPHLWTLRSSLAFHHLQPYPSPVSYPWPRPARLAEPARRPRPYPEAPPQSLSPRPAPCPVTPSRTAFARLVKPSSWL